MEKRELNPERKLQKIIELIIENKSDTINVSKLKDIIGNENLHDRKISNPFIQRKSYTDYKQNNGYIENYIS